VTELAPPALMLADDAEMIVPVVMFIGLTIVGAVWVLSYQRRREREAAYNARLKQMMIERGMSAAEIEQIVRATPDEKAARSAQRWGCREQRRPMEV
jgi:hypothetical protein